MSIKSRRGQSLTARFERASNDVLATVVRKQLSYDHLPGWFEATQSEWAIQDTIERVAGEQL